MKRMEAYDRVELRAMANAVMNGEDIDDEYFEPVEATHNSRRKMKEDSWER